MDIDNRLMKLAELALLKSDAEGEEARSKIWLWVMSN